LVIFGCIMKTLHIVQSWVDHNTPWVPR